MRSLGGYYSDFGDDMAKDMRAQEKNATMKRLEPADTGMFLAAITQALREKEHTYDALMKRHQQIKSHFDKAEVGLHKLSSLRVEHQNRLEKIKQDLRNLVRDNQGTDYVLQRCKKILNETSVVAQMVGEGLKPTIADKHKKMGLQSEVALRLRDIDEQFDRCHDSLIKEEDAQKRLLHELQQLLAATGKKLAPNVKEAWDHKGKIMEMVLDQQKRIKTENTLRVEKPGTEKKVEQKYPDIKLDNLSLTFKGLAEEGVPAPSLFDTSTGKVVLVLLGAAATTAIIKMVS